MKPFNILHGLKLCFYLLVLSAVASSCKPEEVVPPSDDPGDGARIVREEHIAASHMKTYHFVYPSVDPYGNPTTLSGTITMSDALQAGDLAEGIMLYNHFTIYRADQCPSRGGLEEQAFIVDSRLITISPDYYGFGVTEEQPQSYCLSSANARASVDALIEGRKLLEKMGYRWKDNLFNAGYSQGGQTTIAVLREVSQRHPDIHFTCSFAGAGPYDLPATYRRFVIIDKSAMPSTVVSVMLSYNHFKHLGIARDSMFIEPLLSHIDEWVLSKRYTRTEIDSLVGTYSISAFIHPNMMDIDHPNSQLLMEALDSDNLCKGWTPRSNEPIVLVHHTLDGAVPVENTTNLAAFLEQQGVENLTVMMDDYGSYFGMPAHETGAIVFINTAKEIISQYLGISW